MKQPLFRGESAAPTTSNSSLPLHPWANTSSTVHTNSLESRKSRVLADKANNLGDPSLNSNCPTDDRLNKMNGSFLSEKLSQKNPRRVHTHQPDGREQSLLMAMDKEESFSLAMETTSNVFCSEEDANHDHEGNIMTASSKQGEARDGCINPVSRILWETDEDEEMGEQQQDAHDTELWESPSPSFRVVSPVKGSSLPNLSVARPMPVRPILLA